MAPAEWNVKLRSVETKQESESEKKKGVFEGVKLKKAPKPGDFEGQGEVIPKVEDNKEGKKEGNMEGNVFETVRAGLKKVPQK
jgi:hypothetical protein